MRYYIKIAAIWTITLGLGLSCRETPPRIAARSLTDAEKENVRAISADFNSLIRRKEVLEFTRTFSNRTDKSLVMREFLSSHFSGQELEMTVRLFEQLTSPTGRSNLRENETENIFHVSPEVELLTRYLLNQIKNTILAEQNGNYSRDRLSLNLKAVFDGFKSKVNESSNLTFEEYRGLLAFAEFEKNSIEEAINLTNTLTGNSNGRTQGWFSDLIQVVVTAVVAAVVVVAVVATGGAAAVAAGIYISAATWGTMIAAGAVVGGLYGIAVGYDMSVNQNSYFTDFDPSNVQGAFLDWEHCTSNPGHWACI